ncbi:hypothetical protein GCK72_006005 [Caenorhabditis remanei]|uniref:Uncharacterized protein n=1 Tax=Caenorhabditis remanei TaxID=31234 RepID=A0A6A5HFP0_CAERE|nr:hypothetical protein GCK72_006005 [Caenorhabditis remanei]KAF1766049.1 hypothetical protein GCK72_006005 [Caenorhabditis remanei]
MGSEEEYFIVRYRGPRQDREAIYNCLTGKANDFGQYSAFLKDVNVGRAKCMKDVFDFIMPSESTNLSRKQNKSNEKRRYSNQSHSNSSGYLQEFQEGTDNLEYRGELRSIQPLYASSSSAPESLVETTTDREVKEEYPDAYPYTLPSTSRQFPSYQQVRVQNDGYMQQLPSRIPYSPHGTTVNRGRARNNQYYRPYPTVTSDQPRTELVSSQTLKRHNICFERKAEH